MATPFDEGRLAVTGSAVRVAADVNFDYGIWRGVFSVSQNGMLVFQRAQDTGRRPAPMGRPVRKGPEHDRRAHRGLRPADRSRRAAGLGPRGRPQQRHLDLRPRARRAHAADDRRPGPDVPGLVAGRLGDPVRQRSERSGGLPNTRSPAISALGAGEGRVAWRSKERLEVTDWSRDGRYALDRPRQHPGHRHLGLSPGRAREGLPAGPDGESRRRRPVLAGRTLDRLHVSAVLAVRGLRHGVPGGGRALAGLGERRDGRPLGARRQDDLLPLARQPGDGGCLWTAPGRSSASERPSRSSRSTCSPVPASRAASSSRRTASASSSTAPATSRRRGSSSISNWTSALANDPGALTAGIESRPQS